MDNALGAIRVGVGGWSFDGWRDNFYPPKLAAARELAYASRRLSAIEINSTFHGTQKPSSFAKWRDTAPAGFVFSVKASRYATHRTRLAEAGESVARFIGSGIEELGDKLGPLLWQFPATKAFDADDFDAFLALLPCELAGRPLRHALDVRHASFACEAFEAMARRHGAAVVWSDDAKLARIDAPTAGFVYARLMQAQAGQPLGYADDALDAIAARARGWAQGGGDVFAFFINGAKERAPAAAMALIERLGGLPRAPDDGAAGKPPARKRSGGAAAG